MATLSKQIAELIAAAEKAAYERGVADAKRAMQDGMAKLSATSTLSVNATVRKAAPRGRGSRAAPGVRPNSDASKVLDAIKTNPGHTGADIHRWMKANSLEVNERTMRTALRRLRKRGLIEQREGVWFKK